MNDIECHLGPSVLALDDDDMRAHLAVHGARPEATRDGARGHGGRLIKPRSVARLNFVTKRRPLAERHRGSACRERATPCRQGGELRRLVEPPSKKVARNDGKVVVPVRDTLRELWRIFRKNRSQRPAYCLGKLVLIKSIPHAKEE